MARIRSIHPGIFTDEAFMSASAHARLLIIGLWCEAYDDGAVELKPLTLKARIFPADNVDITALLDELEGLNYFKRFKAQNKDWAAIRNFKRFQRPKKPNNSHVFPPDLISYVGGGEEVPHQSGTGGEKPPQREDGGGNRKEEKKKDILPEGESDKAEKVAKPRAKNVYSDDFERFWKAYPDTTNNSKPNAFAEWAHLSSEDRQAAFDGLPGFTRYCRDRPDYRCVYSERYLSERRFDGYQPRRDSAGTAIRELGWAQTA